MPLVSATAQGKMDRITTLSDSGPHHTWKYFKCYNPFNFFLNTSIFKAKVCHGSTAAALAWASLSPMATVLAKADGEGKGKSTFSP